MSNRYPRHLAAEISFGHFYILHKWNHTYVLLHICLLSLHIMFESLIHIFAVGVHAPLLWRCHD